MKVVVHGHHHDRLDSSARWEGQGFRGFGVGRLGRDFEMTPRHIVLALDFDRVLHPLNSRTESMFCRLDLLEAWPRARPAIRVLITSTWRETHSIDELVSFFSEDLQHRIAGVTPVYEEVFGKQGARSSEEIAATQCVRLPEPGRL